MRVKLLNSDSIKDTIGDKLDEMPDIYEGEMLTVT